MQSPAPNRQTRSGPSVPRPATDRGAAEARALAEDISGRRGEIVQLERELSLMPAEALGGLVRQARQAVEVELFLVLAEALGRLVRQAL